MTDDCQEKTDSDCPKCQSPPSHIGKARDIFVAAENVMPMIFTGLKVTYLMKAKSEEERQWSATSVFKLNAGGFKPGSLWVSTACYGRLPAGCASAMTELNPKSGNWNFEAFCRTAGDQLHGAVAAQVIDWNQPAIIRMDLDYMCPDKTISLSVDPKIKDCSFEYIQAVSDRLSVGGEVAFSKSCGFGGRRSRRTEIRPAAIVKYTGADYVLSGKLNPIVGAVKGAYYRRLSDSLHVGATVEMDAARSLAVSRLAFRVVSDTSVFRAAVGTDGVVNSVWERRLGYRCSAVLSSFVNHANKKVGLGIGVSVE